MQIDILAFPWPQYKELFEQGKLDDDAFLDSEENEAMWDDAPCFSDQVGDSYSFYHCIYDDTAWFEHTDYAEKESFLQFCNALLNEEFESDLGSIECIETVISPERITALCEHASKIDLNEIKRWHDTICAEGVDLLGDGNKQVYGMETAAEEYVSYIQKLIDFVKSVEGKGRCLAIHLG